MIENWHEALIDLSYVVAAILFIVGLKRLSHPTTARRGNQLSAAGMAVAIIATLFQPGLQNHLLIIIGLIVGAAVSIYPARVVKMTAMPQMVAIFNGVGGGASALIAIVEFQHRQDLPFGEALSVVLGILIGAIAFTGSFVAFAKLQGLVTGRPITYPSQQLVNAAIGVLILALGLAILFLGEGDLSRVLVVLLFVAALVIGVLVVLPIGGADMPVVISIHNSLTGVAAVLTGFITQNQAMIIAGVLVGASGTLLSLLMARAMNRSVANILFGAFGAVQSGAAGAGGGAEELPMREATPDDVAVPLAYAQRVIIVPGYGLAVAQAQHSVRELADVLEERGVDVKYAIHPVAGRMPGHMNVLLAEANVPYEDLREMDEINDEFATADVAIVVGANDVTNPAARNDPSSPIYGMPVLNVEQAKSILVLKRGKGSGFAGIENELFYNPKTSMLFGDAKDSLANLVTAVKSA